MKKEECPAWGKRCKNCNGRNHFQSKCDKVHILEEEKDSSDSGESCLNAINTIGNTSNNAISTLMEVNECDVSFQLDSGADVMTIQK